MPFCTKKCGYCDFFSVAGASGEVIEATLSQTTRDLSRALELLMSRVNPSTIPSVYVGGGTPGMLSPAMLGPFLRDIERALPAGVREYTCEANPETITREKLDLMAELGVNRVSMGIQSFDDSALRYLGRAATPEANRRAMELLSLHFEGEVNVDLMTGIPGQRAGDVEGELAEVLAFAPNHISLYSLTVEEGTPLAKEIASGEKTSPEPSMQTDSWTEGVTALEAAGYEWYEISNFAKPGHRCRHNMGYWQMDPYLGVGPGAASTLNSATGPVRITANAHLPEPRYDIEPLTPKELLLEHFMMGLRTRDGVSRRRVEAIFDREPRSCAPRTIEKAVDNGLLLANEEAIITTRAGRMVLDSILADIAVELEPLPLPVCRWPTTTTGKTGNHGQY